MFWYFFLASVETPNPKKPIEINIKPVKRARKNRKTLLKEFMKDQGWTKTDVQKILDTL
jgi:hypothetical protein